MAAEFIDLLNLPELDIGHSKKVLFSSDQTYAGSAGDNSCRAALSARQHRR